MLDNMSAFELVYAGFAVFGGICFIAVLVMQLTGMGDGVDTDAGIDPGLDTGLDVDLDTGPHTDADVSFKMLSFQGLVTFCLMFGLVGLAATKDQWGVFPAFAAAVAAGLLSVWLIGRVFRLATSLQSSGTQQIGDLTGQSATVYTRIPGDGIGKINVTVNNRMVELLAKSADGSGIATGEFVEITEMQGSNTVLVKRK